MSISTSNARDGVIDIVLYANGMSEGGSAVRFDAAILKKIISAFSTFSINHNNPSFIEDDQSSRYESISQPDWEGYLARFLIVISDSDDERISKQIISAILTIHHQLSDDNLHWLFNEFLEYISEKFIRKYHHRSTNLGSHAEIDLDDTTGWQHLEANIKAAQTILLTALQRPNNGDLFLRFMQQSVSEGYRTAVWQLIIEKASQHVNRYIRENTFAFLASFFAENNLSQVLLETTLINKQQEESEELKLTLLSSLLNLLPAGLEDDWSQVRYAASEALQACLDKIWSIYHCENEREKAVQSQASSLLPILCLNRFHAAPSIQTISHNIWIVYFQPLFLGRRLLVQNVAQAVSYYHKQMQTAKNHMVCEAACHALCELLVRMEYEVVVEYTLPSLDVLLDCCLMDERWPVKDAACISSGRILQRFPLSIVSDDTDGCSRLARFVNHFEHHLQDCIASVRENAAVAFVQAMLSSNTESNQFLLKAAVKYIDQFLVVGAEDVEERQQVGEVPQQSRIQSFLPLAMLQKKHQESEGNSSVDDNFARQLPNMPTMMEMGSEAAGTVVDLNILRAMTSHQDNSNNANPDMMAMRKGWGCCMDCVELRTAQPWELSHGALCLLREIVMHKLHPQLFLVEKEQLLFILKKTNCKSVDKLHTAVYEQLPVMIKAVPVEHKDEMQEFLLELCQQCIGRDLMLLSPPPPPPPQQSQTKQQKHGYTVRKASSNNNTSRGRHLSSVEEKRNIAAEQCLQTIVRECDHLWVNWKELFLEEQLAFAISSLSTESAVLLYL